MLTEHGDDTYRYKGIRLNFSSNILRSTDTTALETYLKGRLGAVRSYPEPEAFTLQHKLAERTGVDPRCLLVTNGATEAIYLLAQAFSRKISVIAQPTFSEYKAACELYGHVDNYAGNVCWICNPNNPTGSVTDKRELKETIRKNRSTFYIIDQAYEDYTTEETLRDGEAIAAGNVAIIHSMTKQYGVPGLRLGYLVTNAVLTNKLRRLKQPWSVNALAIEAGLFLVEHGRRPDTSSLLREAQRLRRALDDIKGISVMPTKTNFMLGTTSKGNAALLKDFLARRGMLIRDASNFVGLSPYHFRVAAQRPEDDNELIEAIKEYAETWDMH